MNGKRITNIFLTIGILVLLFLGFTEHIQGARNVVTWVLWFMVAMCAIVIFSGQSKTLNDKRTLPLALELITDLFIGGFLLWYAQWWLGGTFIITSLFIALSGKSSAEELAEKKRIEDEKKNKEKFKDGVKKFDF